MTLMPPASVAASSTSGGPVDRSFSSGGSVRDVPATAPSNASSPSLEGRSGASSRAGRSMSGGGSGANKTPNCLKLDKIIAKKIRNVFKFFDIKFETNVIALIKNKYDEIILNLLKNIRAIKGDITDKKVEQLILKSKIMKK
jgi:hypothetical protein